MPYSLHECAHTMATDYEELKGTSLNASLLRLKFGLNENLTNEKFTIIKRML